MHFSIALFKKLKNFCMKKFYPATYGKACLLLLFSVISLFTYAQTGINGAVKNANDGSPVINATVSLKLLNN